MALTFDASLADDEVKTLTKAWQDIAVASVPADLSLRVGKRGGEPGLGVSAVDLAHTASMLTSVVTLRLLDAVGGSLLLFHACAVTDEQGRVIAFVGPSGRGKTTAARALGRSYGYVTDETLAVDDAEGCDVVLPYRKPLSVIERADMPKRQIAPSDFALRPLPDAELRLAALLLLERDPDHAGAPSVEPVDLREGIPLLVPQMSYLARIERPLQRIAAALDRRGGLRRVRYAEAETLVDAAVDLFDASPIPAAWEPLPIESSHEEWAFAEGVLDAILVPGALVVLTVKQALIIGGIGPAVCAAVGEGADILAHVRQQHGEPPTGDAAELVEVCLADLGAAGVLSRRAERDVSGRCPTHDHVDRKV